MSGSDGPAALFEPETESIPHSLDEESQSQPDQKDAITRVPDNNDNAETKPELQDDNTVQEDNDNTSSKPELQDDSTSLTFDASREDNDSEKLETVPPPTTVVNSSDFQKVMDSINEPLHDDKLLDFVSNLDDHPSSQSLDEKLLDSVGEHETPEETMQVEQLMESIHNEKSDIDDRNQLQRNRSNETLTFQKIERSGQITDHKILDENDFKSDKELRLDNGNVTLTTGTSLMLTPMFGDTQRGVGSDIKPVSTIGDESVTNVVTKTEVDISPESYLSQVTGMGTDDLQQQSVPVYDTVENKNDPKVFEAKDCLQKAMEAINQPITEGNDNVGSTVEDVLSALHSDVSSSKDIKDEDTGSSEGRSEIKITTKESVAPSAKRPTKDLKDKNSPKCFVACCDSGKTDCGEVRRFFKPPPNPLIFKRWARNLCQGSQLLSFNSWICENHFRTSDMQEVFVNGKKKWELSKGALPKINVNKTTFQNFVAKKRSDDKRGRGPSIYRSTATEDPDAQEEITSLDVLVCGLCHTVFHFFEEFQDHKLNINCRGTSTFKASLSEPKPQVWAFLLWKNAQTKIIGDMESSWKLYQRWCKMPENLRDTWVAAGKALQDASSVGHIKITDLSNKIGRPKSVTEQVDMDEEEIKLNDIPVEIEVDTGAGGDSSRFSRRMKPFKESIIKTESDIIISENIEIKEEPGQLKPPHDGQIIQEEFVVEKIVSRRLNQKKRQYEYLLKWEGYPPEQNTWEPEENMSTCKHLLKEFEANLAKANKSAVLSKTPASVLSQKKAEIMMPSTSAQITIPLTSGGRPVRSSKQKALDQVKVWCGSMIKTPDTDTPGKRRSSDIDSEDEEDMAIAKRIKLEQESDDSDAEVSRRPAKRFAGARGGKTPGKPGRPPAGLNGVKKESNLAAALGLESSGEESGPERSPSRINKPVIRNMSSLSPQNQQVLVASAKGVVKVDPTQVPNLTSGVYIMSNKSGIVKLDSVTPSSALSSLQKKGVLKAAPGKGGVIMLDSSKPGSIAHKSGIIRKVQAAATLSTAAQSSTSESLITSTTSMPTSITVQTTQNKTLPKGAFLTGSSTKPVLSTANLPQRPAGILRPIRPGISPRPVGLLRAAPGGPRLPTSTTKVTPVRSRVMSNVSANRGRAPLSNLLKSGIKPIESILGTANSSSTVVQKSESDVLKDEDFPTSSGIVTINPVKKAVGNNVRNRPGRGGGPARNVSGRRGNLASLVGMTMEDDDKLKDDDDIFTDMADQPSSDTDDGIPDDFPIGDLPPIEPDSPPRPLTLCPLTGKVLLKAEGEKTPEPTPPPSPSTENKEKTVLPEEESANSEVKGDVSTDSQSVTNSSRSDVATTPSSSAVNTVNSNTITITDTSSSSITVKRISSSANQRGSRTVAGNVSVLNSSNSSTTNNTGSTSLGTITVPARKLFHQSQTPVTVATPTTTSTTVTTTEQTEEQDVVTITGEDGLLYQVANADVSGNTLLVSSGEGGQQCVYVTTEASGEHVEGDESTTSAVLTLDTAYADAVAQLIPEQFYVKEGEGGELVSLEEAGEEGGVVSASDDGAGQVVAQLVEAGEPAPGGGPRRVVLLLPDGNLMMTEVDEEQYAALELDK